MTVRVRSAEGGELEYGSLAEAREGLRTGLIGPRDQVQLGPTEPWQPASALGPAPGSPLAARLWRQALGTLAVVALGARALWALKAGAVLEAAVLSLALALLLTGVTVWSARRRRPGA